MNINTICEKLKEIVGSTLKKRVDISNLNSNTDLVEDIGLSSIEAIQILIRAENEFGIRLEEKEFSIELVRTIFDLAEYINKKIA